VLNSRTYNDLGSITVYVALQHRGSAPAPVQKLDKWKILAVCQWSIYQSAKIY